MVYLGLGHFFHHNKNFHMNFIEFSLFFFHKTKKILNIHIYNMFDILDLEVPPWGVPRPPRVKY